MGTEEDHDLLHLSLGVEGFAELDDPGLPEPRDFAESLRLLVDDPQGVLAQHVCDAFGESGADSLDQAGGEVGADALDAAGQHRFEGFDVDLGAESGVLYALTGYPKLLAFPELCELSYGAEGR